MPAILAQTTAQEATISQDCDKLPSVETDDVVGLVRRAATERLRCSGLLWRLAATVLLSAILVACDGANPPDSLESSPRDQGAAGEQADASDDGDGATPSPKPATCPEVAPSVLPSGAEPGQPTDFETDYGQGLEWGDGDDRVVLVSNEVAWAVKGGQEEFQANLDDGMYDSVSGPDGTTRVVVAIGEAPAATVQILFQEGDCDYLLFTTLPYETALEYAAAF